MAPPTSREIYNKSSSDDSDDIIRFSPKTRGRIRNAYKYAPEGRCCHQLLPIPTETSPRSGQPISRTRLPSLPAASSLELEYPELTIRPLNATITAVDIAEMPILRDLELRRDKVLVGLHRGKMNLEASLGQI
jgi:hypothetical protein